MLRLREYYADDSRYDVLLCFASAAFGWPTSYFGGRGARRSIVCVLYFSRVALASQMDCGTDKLMDEISDNTMAAVQHVEVEWK